MTAHPSIKHSSWAMMVLLFIPTVWNCCCVLVVHGKRSPSQNCDSISIPIHHHRAHLHKTSSSSKPSSPYATRAAYNLLFNIRGGDIQQITSLSQVKEIIENASNTNQLVVLDFTSNNCPPCEMIAPIYSDLSELEEFESKVIFLKVNVSDHPDVASYYGVDGWPTFQLFRNELLVDSIVGGQAAKAGLYPLVARHAQ
ncbi:thioredoxin family protein [Skeletonema marinoi]|uniref:Thioredoxin family protein n=1 Tax=Skeletonema marinoi TaxID=267567 RepID=A0AAD8XXD5_9STRA|nr:thioredoxin family protein [Skeletonema marinoi]